MFTKENYKEYFDQIARTERMMIYRVHNILPHLDDGSVKTVLEGIAQDELKHYVLVKDALDVFLLEGEAEKRKYQRESSLGNIEVGRKGADQKTEAWCVNMSQSGVCIESEKPFKQGDRVKLSIKLYNKDESIDKTARIVWTNQIQPNFYITGAEFE